MDTAKKRQLSGMAAGFLANCFFGVTFVFVKQMLNMGMTFYAMLTWRTFLAMGVLWLLVAFKVFRVRFRGKPWWRLIPVAMCGHCIYYFCETFGIERTTASESGTILALIPISTLLFSRLLYQVRPTGLQILSIMLSVAGVVIIVLAKGASASFSISGYLFLFGAVALVGLFSNIMRWVWDDFSSMEITLGINSVGFCWWLLLSLLDGLLNGGLLAKWLLPLQQPALIWQLLGLVLLGSVGALALNNFSLLQIGANRNSIFTGFNVLTSVVLGVLWLGESLLAGQIIGGLLIIGGVVGANYFAASEALPARNTVPETAPEPEQLSEN